jgi:hypothetical protein
MDQRELSTDFGRAPAVDSGETERLSLDTPNAHDLEGPDGDGGMLGRVLIYAAIIGVVTVTIWNLIA